MKISKFNSFYYEAAFSASATAYFNQVTSNGGSLTNAEKTYINTFIGALGTDFAEFDRLWIHGLSNSIAARTSLANPTSTMITAVNSPTFTASQGYNGNGTTSYLNLNYNPNSNSVKLTLNSASKGTYYRAIPTNNSAEGALTTVGIYNYFSVGNFRVAVNTPSDYLSGLGRNAKLNVVYRNNSTQMYGNLNGVDSTVITQSSSALPNVNAFALSLNYSGTPILFQAEQESVNFYGSGNINFLNLYTAIQALGTSIGWAV
jgi:hypothetical protein